MGISKISNFGDDNKPYNARFIKEWPNIFKWSELFFATRVRPSNVHPQSRRLALDVITATWYALCRDEEVRAIMAPTPGCIEMATSMWLLEDGVGVPSSIAVPTASAAFERLLRKTDKSLLNRVVRDQGAKKISDTAIARYKDKISKPKMTPPRGAVFSDVLNQLSRSPEHVLRHNLLVRGVVQWEVKGALAACQQLERFRDPGHIDTAVASLGYLGNCLESSDGFTWVTQAIRAGLLNAFVECSPYLDMVGDPDDRDLIVLVIRDILPRYLVYRSVLQAVDKALAVVDVPAKRQKVLNSPVAKVWESFFNLAKERTKVCVYATAAKDYGKVCDNLKCGKIDKKQNFRQCSGCLSTLYCSKECQVEAWKEGDHKAVCKLKQREREEGKEDPISHADARFLHQLPIRDARRNMHKVRELAKTKYPNLDPRKLLICIDYYKQPEEYSVEPIDTYELDVSNGTKNAKARNIALYDKVKNNTDELTLILSTIANGSGALIVSTQVKSAVWNEPGHGVLEDESQLAAYLEQAMSMNDDFPEVD